MSIHIIIDGYNLIRQSQALSDLDRQALQLGRDALIDLLAEYKKIKHHKITVVFDGTHAFLSLKQNDNFKGIAVKFSSNGETADTVIKRMVFKEREKALVVSSDREIVNYARSLNAATIDSLEFEDKILMAAYINIKGAVESDKGGWVPTTKKKGPKRRLSKKDRRDRIKVKKL